MRTRRSQRGALDSRGDDLSPEIFGAKLPSVRRSIELSFLRGFRSVMATAVALALLGGVAAWRLLE